MPNVTSQYKPTIEIKITTENDDGTTKVTIYSVDTITMNATRSVAPVYIPGSVFPRTFPVGSSEITFEGTIKGPPVVSIIDQNSKITNEDKKEDSNESKQTQDRFDLLELE